MLCLLILIFILYNLSDTTLNKLIFFFFLHEKIVLYILCMYVCIAICQCVKSLFEWCWYEKVKPSLSH